MTLYGNDRLKYLQQTIRLAHVKEGKEELLSLCQEYNDIFRLPGDRLTEVKGLAHTIPTPHINPHKPVTLKNYRLPKAHQDEVQKQVEFMLEQDIIKPSQSPWNFPLLVVPKKIDASGKRKWRICVDFRQLNNDTIGDSFPLPNIQDILDKLGRARYFSALDCASGYWQIPSAEEDQCKTAFSTTSGTL
ncbi:hypothetical protein ANN_26880 [Periplaneta americana]|uniref:Reverse transcriptase domain-containing protein n=1 Tax=Periplaneta americana TaxID=6978 RepID=A0ABQ8RWG4_PERAM|nr:hypothetical protein ANN_26880 [Periplaneta americana]